MSAQVERLVPTNRTSSTRARQPRGRARRDWPVRFLEALALIPNVSAACDTAQVDRTTAYFKRRNDEDFAAAWEDALEQALDRAEREVARRGLTGWDEPVFGTVLIPQGEEGAGEKVTGQVGTIRRYDSKLLLALLGAYRPERWAQRHRMELAGRGGGPIDVAISPGVELADRLLRMADRVAGGGEDPGVVDQG